MLVLLANRLRRQVIRGENLSLSLEIIHLMAEGGKRVTHSMECLLLMWSEYTGVDLSHEHRCLLSVRVFCVTDQILPGWLSRLSEVGIGSCRI